MAFFFCIKYINRLRQPGEFVQCSEPSSGHPPALAREAILRNCGIWALPLSLLPLWSSILCMQPDLYTAVCAVVSTTRSHNQDWETRWTGESHRRMASTMMWVYLISSVLPSIVVYDNCIFRSPAQMTALSECLVDFSFSLLFLNSLLTLSYCACGCLKSAQKPWNSSIRRLFCRSISTKRSKGKDWNWAYFVRLVPYGWRIFLLLPQTEHRNAVDCFL